MRIRPRRHPRSPWPGFALALLATAALALILVSALDFTPEPRAQGTHGAHHR